MTSQRKKALFNLNFKTQKSRLKLSNLKFELFRKILFRKSQKVALYCITGQV